MGTEITDLEAAEAAVDASNTAYRHAVSANAAASLVALALLAKAYHPDAAYVGYEWSDQGSDSLVTGGLYNAALDDLFEANPDLDEDTFTSDDAWPFISNLGDLNDSVWMPFRRHVPPEAPLGASLDLINVEMVIDALIPYGDGSAKVQILHVRDPDSSCEHQVWIDGKPAADDVEIEDVDPGRGYEPQDWEERIEDYADDDSPFGQAVSRALEANKDSRYNL